MIKHYVCEFHYSDNVLENMKPVYEAIFTKMYGIAVDMINPMIASFNDEYDRLYGTVEDEKHYNLWFGKKEQKILDIVNENYESPIKLYTNDEACIVGRFYDNYLKSDVTMYFTVHENER